MTNTAPVPNVRPAMNPAVIVAGGGGGGGGSGGKKGKAKGGKQGAGTGKGDGDPQGGDQSADGCGAGGNGACTNCGSQVSRGDPFDVVTGEVFTVSKQDLYLPGTFGLKLVRQYTSSRRDCDLGMGWGWVHTLGWTLSRDDGMLVIRTGDGRTVELQDIAGEEGECSDGVWTVLKGKTYYAVDPGNEFVHFFTQLDGPQSPFLLTEVTYRHRGHIALEYEQGMLRTVIDSVGREIRFRSTPEGRISSIGVPNDQGVAVTFARFDYDDSGRLVAATDADGATTQYRYNEDNLLTRLLYPSGTTFHFVYDREGRCTETWGEPAAGPDPVLSEDVPATLADGQTRAKGIYHCRADYLDDEYIEVIDSVRMQRFFSGPHGQVAKAVGARGQVTERTFDEYGNVATQTDPMGGVWKWERDAAGRILKETSPEGHTIEVKYDEQGRELEVRDPAGGKTTIARDSWGEIEWVTNQIDAQRVFTRDERGSMTQAIDERGAQHLFEYDEHANLSARVFPMGSRYEYRYDYWGRLIAGRTPLGRETHYSYTPNGRLSEVVSSDGSVTRYQYDAMGNETGVVLPDGSMTRADYAGHNWLYRLTHPDGHQIQIRRNREGWIEYLENERGERHCYTLHSDGLVAEERDFIGVNHHYAYDELGRTISIEKGNGKHEFEYDRVGQLKSHLAGDGGQRQFEYNLLGQTTQAIQNGVELNLEYDATGRVVSEELRFDDATYKVTSQRDRGGARMRLESSLGHSVQIRRNASGQVIELLSDKEHTLQFQRDAEGRIVRRELSQGGAIIHQWDLEGRLGRTEVVAKGAPEHPSLEPDWFSERRPAAYARQYEYNQLNEIARISTSDGGFTEYEYDTRHHLTSARSSEGRIEQFNVDPTSNYYSQSPDAPKRVFEAGSQLKSHGDWEYEYGADGELIGKRRRLSDGSYEDWWRFTYDGFGFLQSVHRPDGLHVEFEYDAYARRVKKAVYQNNELIRKVHYVWDLVTLLHEITFLPGEETPQVRTYLYEDNNDPVPLGHRDSGSYAEQVYYVTDLNGYPLEIVDASGKVRVQLRHRIFGEPTLQPGESTPTSLRFSGQFSDEETGLYYNRYRYYDPEVGRYITPDPIGIFGGLNLYAYTPNPIGWTDAMGWYHTLDVEKAPAGFLSYIRESGSIYPYVDQGRHAYRSGGMGDDSGTPCPEVLKTERGCHTEQKFVKDLLDWHQQETDAGNQGAKDQTFVLKGKLPPCRNCHHAMMRAAKETGAKIEYKWGNKKITYDGSSTRGPSKFSKDVTLGFEGTEKYKRRYERSTPEDDWTMPTEKPSGKRAPDWGVRPRPKRQKKS